MRVEDAKALARQWVTEEAAPLRGFAGVYLAGSITWLPGDAELPPTSDIDVWVVLDGADASLKHGKVVYQDVILDVSYVAIDQLGPAERILGDYHMAGSFRTPGVIADPTGQLTTLQAAVSRDYAKREWVEKRCAHARDHALRYVHSLDVSHPIHDQVMSWTFATGITTHVLLVAGLKNPTVRRRYAAVREILADYGHLDFYETLLEMLGCAGMDRERVAYHLAALTDAFDAAKAVARTPLVFSADITDIARPIAIDGSRDLIEQGLHREAVFWMVVTYSRCQKILYHDATVDIQETCSQGYRELLADLGIVSPADLQQCTAHVTELLPRVWDVAEAIVAANPAIED